MSKTMKRIFAAVISIVLTAALFTSCTGGSGDKRVLKLGLDASFPPMGFKDDSGKLVGFDLDVAAELVKLLDDYDEVEFIPIEWSAKNTELNTGNIDLIWNGFTMQGREADYAWTEPYLKNEQMIVVKEGSEIKSVADLAGKVVVVQDDSSGLKAVEKNETVMSTIKTLNKVGDYENALMELESGAADAMVIDNIVIDYKIKQGKTGLTILRETLGAEDYGIAFKTDNTDLRDKVQTALNTLAENGKLAEISTKWFGSDITTIGK